MKDVVCNALSIEKNLDYASLSKHAKIKFNDKYKTKEVRIITKEEDSYLESIKDDEMLSFCNRLEAMSPAELLQEISGIKPSSSELSIASDLINNTKLPVAVINFMFLLANYEKNGEIPGYAYFEKIANTWARAKVKTLQDAINYVEKKQKERLEKVNTSKGNSKSAVKPAWYGKYTEELDKKFEDNKDLNNDEVKSILETANKLFGGEDEQ